MFWIVVFYIATFTCAAGAIALICLRFSNHSPLERLVVFLPRSAKPVTTQHEKDQLGLPEATFRERVLMPAMTRCVNIINRFSPETMKMRADKLLADAGHPYNFDVPAYMAVKVVLILGGTILTLILAPRLGMGEMSLVMAMVGGGFGYVIPDFLLGGVASKRKDQISQKLPETLDLLTVSIEAGLGFDGALQKVCEKTTGPLADEFNRMLQEIQVGKARRDAFRALADRTSVEDLTSFLNALIQADKLGVSMGNILRVQSAEIRRRKRQRAEEQAMKVSVKIIFPMVLFILPGLFLVVLGPAILQIMENLTF